MNQAQRPYQKKAYFILIFSRSVLRLSRIADTDIFYTGHFKTRAEYKKKCENADYPKNDIFMIKVIY